MLCTGMCVYFLKPKVQSTVIFKAHIHTRYSSSNKENKTHLRNYGQEELVSLIKSLFWVSVCQMSFHPSHKGLCWLPRFEGTQAASLTADRARVNYRPIGSFDRWPCPAVWSVPRGGSTRSLPSSILPFPLGCADELELLDEAHTKVQALQLERQMDSTSQALFRALSRSSGRTVFHPLAPSLSHDSRTWGLSLFGQFL